MHRNSKRSAFIVACVGPALLFYFIFMVIPTLNVFRMSLYERGAYSPVESFVGLDNFRTLFKDRSFILAMQNTLFLVVLVSVITLSLALIYAAFMSRARVRGKSIFRVIFYIPNILSIVVVSGIFSAIYKPDQGLLNSLLSFFAGREVNLMWKDQNLVMYSLLIAMVWQALGYYMVMYMAAMAAVPESIYESAAIDGSGRVSTFFRITLPLIWTNIRTTLTFFIISGINMAFLFVTAMTSGGPNGRSEVALSFMYAQKNQGLFGYSMAAGVVIFLFSFILSGLVSRATKRPVLEF